MTDTSNLVTVEHLRRLATVDKRSLFAAATILADTDEGIITVPPEALSGVLEGRTRFTEFRLLYSRSTFIEDGVIIGKTPKTIDGGDLDALLAVIAAGINDNSEEPE